MEATIPPSDFDVERARLGAAMLDATGEAARTLDARWFFGKVHDKLARRMRTLAESGKVPDFLVLRSIVQEEGWLDDIGGTQYLIDCMEKCPSVANLPSWDRILLEKYQTRQAIKLCAEVEQHAREHPEELFETLRLLREGTKALDQHAQVRADAVRIMDLQRFRQDDPDELLRDRYLCRGGGLLLAGPTGIGKSSLSMQAMFSWALGKPFFGIEPVRGLRSLLIQAENDEGDLAEIRDGILRGMDASDDEREFLKSMVLTYNETKRTGAAFCQDVMGPLLERHRPALA